MASTDTAAGIALVTKYLTAYKDGDLNALNSCTDPEFTFSDPPFPSLDTKHSKGMFKMFISGREVNKMKLTFTDVQHVSGLEFTSVYTVDYIIFNNPVINVITTNITLSPTSGLILRQVDDFDFWKWTRQSLGVSGLVLGWSSFLLNKVRAQAGGRLNAFVDADEAKASETGTVAPKL